MRSTVGAVRRYSTGIVPTEFEAMPVFLSTELKSIETSMNMLSEGFLEPLSVTPTKPRSGMIRYGRAGVLGATEGVYAYVAGVWRIMT